MPKSPPFPILFLPSGRAVLATKDETVLEVALRNKIDLGHSCGGNASCGTCRIFVNDSHQTLEPRGELELELATDRKFSGAERLACQLRAVPGLRVEIP